MLCAVAAAVVVVCCCCIFFIVVSEWHSHTFNCLFNFELASLFLVVWSTFKVRLHERQSAKVTTHVEAAWEEIAYLLTYLLHGAESFLSITEENIWAVEGWSNRTGMKLAVYLVLFVVVYLAQQPPSGPWPPHSRGFSITHNDAPHSVRLLWTNDQLDAETSTWQHTTFTTDKHPCHRWDSNPQSQQVSGRRPTS